MYVDASHGASGDGSSWAQSKTTISAAISAANSGDEVWVADGTYAATLTLKQGVSLYGGFQGAEISRAERNVRQYSSVISVSNATQAVLINVADVVLDGFSISGGTQAAVKCGSSASAVTIANCTISVSPMEGIRCDHSSPSIAGCLIHSNGDDGIYCSYASPTITNCQIVGNKNHGLNFEHAAPVVSECTILGNKYSGVYSALSSTPALRNSIFVGHASSGVSLTGTSSATIINCLLFSNTPSGTSYGGAIVVNGSSLFSMRNSIVCDNSGRAIRESTGGNNELAHCLFYNNSNGDYFDYENWTTFTGASAININIVGATGTLSGDPRFSALASGTWTSAPSYNASSGITLLSNSNAALQSGSLIGYVINCDTTQKRCALVVDNTATTISVLGFDVATYTQSGDSYLVLDLHTAEDSPAIDAGIDTGAPALDIDGYPRPVDVPSRGAESTGTEFDIGPYEFQPDTSDKSLTVQIVGGGTASPMQGVYSYAANVSLTATPKRGCTFNHWLFSQVVEPPTSPVQFTTTANPYNLSMTKDWQAIAYFDGTPQYILSASAAGDGQVTPSSGTYDENATAVVSATANPGVRFLHWQGDASGTENPLHITMNADKNRTAQFINQYLLNVSCTGDGSVSPGTAIYDEGAQVIVTATPAAGWALRYWQGAATGRANPITIVMESSKSLSAVFTPIRPDLEVSQLAIGASSTIRAGDSLAVSWIVSNTGFAAVQSQWTDRLYLSRDTLVDAGDLMLKSTLQTGALAVGQTQSCFTDFDIPDISPGRYFVLLTTDSDGDITEVDEAAQQTAAHSVTVLDPVLSGSR